MGIFCLINKRKFNFSFTKLETIINNIGFDKIQLFQIGDYHLFISPKIFITEENKYLENTDLGYKIFFFGTFSYRGMTRIDAQKEILQDIIVNEFDKEKLLGCYCIIVFVNESFKIIMDDSNLFRVYCDTEKNILSSSFLVVAELLPSLSVNKFNLTSVILTGLSLGVETTFHEIVRLKNDSNYTEYSEHEKIRKNHYCQNIDLDSLSNLMNENLLNYLESFKDFFSEKVDLGLSGGYDSRLLLALLLKKFQNINIHSNWKRKLDNDLEISINLAKLTNLDLITKSPDEIGIDDNFASIMKDSFYHYDGQIRVNHGWNRYYRSLAYRKNVIQGSILGFSGHNGEQFRNQLHIQDNIHITKPKFVINYLLPYNSSNTLNLKNDVVDYIYQQISWPDEDNQFLDFTDIRNFYLNEWPACGPGIRISIENKLTYYLAPFMERTTINNSLCIPYNLLNHGFLQARMITNLNPELASAISNYGHSFISIPKAFVYVHKLRGVLNPKMIGLIKNIMGINRQIRCEKSAIRVLQGFGVDIFNKKIFSVRIADEHFWDRLQASAYLLDHFRERLS